MSNEAINYLTKYRQASVHPLKIRLNKESNRNENILQLYARGYNQPEYVLTTKTPLKFQSNQFEIKKEPPIPLRKQSQDFKSIEQFKPIPYPEVNNILNSLIQVQESKKSTEKGPSNLQIHEEIRNNHKSNETKYQYASLQNLPKNNVAEQKSSIHGHQQQIYMNTPHVLQHQTNLFEQPSIPFKLEPKVHRLFDEKIPSKQMIPQKSLYGQKNPAILPTLIPISNQNIFQKSH